MASSNDTRTDTAATAAPQDYIGKAKAFAKERPWAFGTLAAIVGLATINTLRGKR